MPSSNNLSHRDSNSPRRVHFAVEFSDGVDMDEWDCLPPSYYGLAPRRPCACYGGLPNSSSQCICASLPDDLEIEYVPATNRWVRYSRRIRDLAIQTAFLVRAPVVYMRVRRDRIRSRDRYGRRHRTGPVYQFEDVLVWGKDDY